ncbi:unnamed protein product [Prunus brigantina]
MLKQTTQAIEKTSKNEEEKMLIKGRNSGGSKACQITFMRMKLTKFLISSFQNYLILHISIQNMEIEIRKKKRMILSSNSQFLTSLM